MWDGVAWQKIGPVPPVASGLPEAPIDGNVYGRENASWVKIGSGITQEVFALAQPNALTVGSTWTPVPYTGTPSIDTMSAWNPANYRYTPTRAGTYLFVARGYASGSGFEAGTAIVKNDAGSFANIQTDIVVGVVTESATGWMYITGPSVMNGTTDFVRVFGTTTAAGPNNWYQTGVSPAFAAWILP
jgi:hypothetical protein